MNRALRRRHAGMMLVLAPLGLLILAGAERLRRPPAVLPALPVMLRPEVTRGRVLAERAADGLALRLLADSAGHAARIEIEPLAPIRSADPLAYWAPAAPGDSLPAGAVLLGSLMEGQPLRAALPGDSGVILVYALATRQIVSRTTLPRPGAAR